MPHSIGPWTMSNRNICDASGNILFLANTANPNESADQRLAVQSPDMLRCIDNIEADNARLRTIHAALLKEAKEMQRDIHRGRISNMGIQAFDNAIHVAIALAREGGDDGPAD